MTNERIAEEVNKDVGRYERRVDEGAPEAWKRMMKGNDPGEIFGSLSVQEQREVDQWKERRTELVHEMQRRDMRDMMDEREDGEERQSRPFVELLVVQAEEGTGTKDDPNPALLRIFDVSDDVYHSLREGVGLRLKGVAVKDNKKNGMVQLLKTKSSGMRALKLDAEALAKSSYAPRRSLSIQELSDRAKLMQEKGTKSHRDSIERFVDFTGTVSKVTKDNHLTTVFFADASGLLVKLRRWYERDVELSTLKQWKLFEASAGSTWRLTNLFLEGYDSFEGISTVVWRSQSELVEVKGSKRSLSSSADGRQSKALKM